MMIELRTIDTPRLPVQVLQGGEGADLVLLHDAGGITAEHPFLNGLSQHFRVHAPLLPGYGDSQEAPHIRDMLDVTLHTFDVVEALGLRRPTLVGCSLGGMIAAEMAAIAPHEVERLVLVDPAGLWLDTHPMPDVFSMMPFELPQVLFHDPELGARLLTGGINMDDPDFLIPFLVNNARTFGMAGKFLFPIPDRGLKDRLYRITARTRIIWGASDKLIPPPYGEAFKAGVRNSDLVVIPKAGHVPHLEQTEATIRAVIDF
jgi:pimeloyl-ACP methyl ester carboxylesterase